MNKVWLEKNMGYLLVGGILLAVGITSFLFFNKSEVSISFYHWKSSLELTDTEEKVIDKKVLFLRCFDVDWDEEREYIVPRGGLRIEKNLPDDSEVNLVVFITNRVFENAPDSLIEKISHTIAKRIEEYEIELAENGVKIVGVQFDCDWTLTTKNRFFNFLNLANERISVPLSATIRLHQIKYAEKTGVPPVQRGMLMFYNMGDLDNPNTQNSILDLNTAKSYVSYCKNYPLPLDVALPIFQWGVVLRDGKVVQLLNAVSANDLQDIERFAKVGEQKYSVLESTYLHGFYCYEGDDIRLEDASQASLEAAATLLNGYLPASKDRKICFYHLDATILQAYPLANLEKIKANFE
jgi:hypothetical protein